jgi:3-oxoacyl-[acyl-carrier protein] reductase
MFRGKAVIVTGGTHGIGAACVRLLADRGARVVFTGRDKAAAETLTAEIKGSVFAEGDASDEGDCRRAIAMARDLDQGRIAGLINNAGMGVRRRFAETTTEDWDRIMAVNLRSAFLFTREALGGLQAARGAVVMISSIAGKVGEEELAAYTASKAGLLGLTQALALEIGASVRVNAICPGQIETRMMARTLALPGRRRQLESRIPSGRIGTAEEVAEAAVWLISPAAAYVNGAILTVDGGETAGLMNPPAPPSTG